MLETGVRWYVVGPGTLRAPDTRVTPPSSRHDRSDPLPSLGSQGAIDAVSQLHGSAPALVTARASPGAVAPDGHTPMTTTIVSQTRQVLREPVRTPCQPPMTLTLGQVVSVAQFIAVCSAYILAETLCYTASLASQL